MATGLLLDERCNAHQGTRGHPERPERLVAIRERLESSGLRAHCTLIPPYYAEEEALLLAHSAPYLSRLRDTCAASPGYMDSIDTPVVPESLEAARLAVGGVLATVDAVWDGSIRNGFCAVRPPGHHAEADRAMGFCLLSNVAIAARYLIKRWNLERVLIVDWDVHHGNGTQHILERDPRVLFCSIHADPTSFYPGSGFAHEVGVGNGEGFTLNVPMPPGSGDHEWHAEFEKRILPRAHAFRPQFVLVSAGFDAHHDDPLGNQQLSSECFAWMTRAVGQVAREHCGGKLVSVLEGGYQLDALAESVEAHLSVLLSLPA